MAPSSKQRRRRLVTDSVNARLAAIFCELLQIDPDELSDSTGPADAPLWDSLNHLNLITAAEKEFGIRYLIGIFLSKDSPFLDHIRIQRAKDSRHPQ